MRPQYDRFGNRFFHSGADNGTYIATTSKSHPDNTKLHAKSSEMNVINCGRDTGDECSNHKPQPRHHGDECTNTHTLRSKL